MTRGQNNPGFLYDAIAAAIDNYVEPAQLLFGLHDLDRCTSGMRPGELIVVAGRPGMGKSGFACRTVFHVASSSIKSRGVLVFSLEAPEMDIAKRMICFQSRNSLSAFRKQALDGAQWSRLVESANLLAELPVWIDDTPAITFAELRSRTVALARDLKEHSDVQLGLVVVDYVQLMSGRDGQPNREQELSEIVRGLKAIARELNVAVLLLSQLNRGLEARGHRFRRPVLCDLRDTGALEDDADIVLMLYRPELYIDDKCSSAAQKFKGYAEIIVAKQRNGPTDRVAVTFADDIGMFMNRAEAVPTEEDD